MNDEKRAVFNSSFIIPHSSFLQKLHGETSAGTGAGTVSRNLTD